MKVKRRVWVDVEVIMSEQASERASVFVVVVLIRLIPIGHINENVVSHFVRL